MVKRICFIRQSIYPFELSFCREVEAVQNAGYETHVICLAAPGNGHSHPLEEMINGVHVHRLPLKRKKTSILRYVYDYGSFFTLASIKLAGMHLRARFDAVQVNTMPDFLAFSTIIPKLLGAKITLMMQEPVPELWQTLHKSPAPWILRATEQWALIYADEVFTVTQQLKEAYVERGADADKITVILNVPDTRFLQTDLKETATRHDPAFFTLICHGAIEERYGHDTILRAVALLKPELSNLRLRILGKGNYVGKFLALSKDLELENCVQYLGWVPLGEVVAEIQASDLGIVAQKSSPYSNLVHTNKMYEYIALGKPVISSRLKSVSAYFGEDALYYFEPGDPESLAKGILDLYQHPDKREALVINAQKLYHPLRWSEQKEKYLSVYQRLLDGRSDDCA